MAPLIFVYNADSGLFNTLADVAHKIFAPATYACRLCALTHHPLGMRQEWKSFLKELGRPLEFLHRDEFRKRFDQHEVALPAIFRQVAEDRLELLLDAAAINSAKTLHDLMRLIRLNAG